MMFKMNAVFGLLLSALMLVGIGTVACFAAVANQYGTWQEVCRPIPYDEFDRRSGQNPYEVFPNAEESYKRGPCPRGQYAVQSGYRVAVTLCRPLPPVSCAETAEYLRVVLEDLRFCPAGQFPMRYGSGVDPEGAFGGLVSCSPLDPAAVSRRWDWRDLKDSDGIGDHPYAWALQIAGGSFCPPNMGMNWSSTDGPRYPGMPPDNP
jgi:hypothetical protein